MKPQKPLKELISPEQYALVVAALGDSDRPRKIPRKIEAIKKIREQTGFGLKEAKDLFDDDEHLTAICEKERPVFRARAVFRCIGECPKDEDGCPETCSSRRLVKVG